MDPTYQATVASYRADPDDNDLRRRLAITAIVMGRIAAENGNSDEASRLIATGMRFAKSSEWPGGLETVPSLNYAHRLHAASQAYLANGDQENGCRLTRQSIELYIDYAKRFQLPVTSLRYRLSPLQSQQKSCSNS